MFMCLFVKYSYPQYVDWSTEMMFGAMLALAVSDPRRLQKRRSSQGTPDSSRSSAPKTSGTTVCQGRKYRDLHHCELFWGGRSRPCRKEKRVVVSIWDRYDLINASVLNLGDVQYDRLSAATANDDGEALFRRQKLGLKVQSVGCAAWFRA